MITFHWRKNIGEKKGRKDIFTFKVINSRDAIIKDTSNQIQITGLRNDEIMKRIVIMLLVNKLLFRCPRPNELPRRGVGSLKPVRIVLGLPRRRDIFTS